MKIDKCTNCGRKEKFGKVNVVIDCEMGGFPVKCNIKSDKAIPTGVKWDGNRIVVATIMTEECEITINYGSHKQK